MKILCEVIVRELYNFSIWRTAQKTFFRYTFSSEFSIKKKKLKNHIRNANEITNILTKNLLYCSKKKCIPMNQLYLRHKELFIIFYLPRINICMISISLLGKWLTIVCLNTFVRIFSYDIARRLIQHSLLLFMSCCFYTRLWVWRFSSNEWIGSKKFPTAFKQAYKINCQILVS